MEALRKTKSLNLNLDQYINRVVPRSQLHRLPKPVSRFLGYREKESSDVGNVLGSITALIGAFSGLAVIAAVFNNTASIQRHTPPALIASFGASAILEFNVIQSPLGQPRNALFGHTLSAIIGVAITKLFLYSSDYGRIQWIAGSLACGISSAVMLLTGTLHPPGGATAVLAATNPQILSMGWYFVPLIMWGTVLMLLVALVVNNVLRKFPQFWWTPEDVRPQREKESDDEEQKIQEKQQGEREDEEKRQEGKSEVTTGEISITAKGVSLPHDLALNHEEAALLETLRWRLERAKEVDSHAWSQPRRYSARSSAELTAVSSH